MNREENVGRPRSEEMHLADVKVHAPTSRPPGSAEIPLADVEINAPARTDARGAQRPEAGPPSRLLTPRELEVLQLVAQGQTNGEIAGNLIISAGAVRTHVQHIIAKLEVVDRTQAAVRASEIGLL